jgi:hypothetical protein
LFFVLRDTYWGLYYEDRTLKPQLDCVLGFLFSSIGDKVVDAGLELRFEVTTCEPNIVIDINEHNLPSEPNFIFNGESWTFSWKPTCDDAGTYEVTFEAPHNGFVDFETIRITVTKVASSDKSLVGYWQMEDDPADGVLDSSRYGNYGTVNGESSPTVLMSGEYEFDGVDDCVVVPDSESLDVDKVTLSAWIYVDRYKNDQRIVSKEKGKKQPYSIYTLLLSGKGEKRLQMRLGLKGVRKRKTVTSTSKIPRNKWVHVVATFNGKKVRLYIDGKLKRSVVVSGTMRKLRHNNQPVYIGDSQFYNRRFDGKMDEVRIYRRALRGSRIRELYRQGRD